MKVSVIVPIYNKGIYLEECFGSLFRQTWSDLEIIAVDDGSADGGLEILRSLAGKDSRIMLLEIPHSGPSVARNTGMERATGDFVAFVDADDMVEPAYMEHLVQGIGKTDVCISGYKIWKQREDCWEDHPCLSGVFSRDEFCQRLHSLKTINGVGWKLYRRSFLMEHLLQFPEQIDRGEDTLFVHHVLLHVQEAACVDDMEYIVRQHDLNSLTHQVFSAEMMEEELAEYRKLREKASDPLLIKEIMHRQTNVLGMLGKIYCFRDLRMRSRKQRFLDAARKYSLERFLMPRSKTEAIARFSLMTRTFLPFYVLVRLLYRHQEDARQYGAEPGGHP